MSPPTTSGPVKKKPKTFREQQGLGAFAGFDKKTINASRRIVVSAIGEGKKKANPDFQCCGCNKGFLSAGGRSSHEPLHCPQAVAFNTTKKKESIDCTFRRPELFAQSGNSIESNALKRWTSKHRSNQEDRRTGTVLKEWWGKQATALVICDNLDAHIAEESKAILAKDQTTFMYTLPPFVTEAIQLADAVSISVCPANNGQM
jgi:hypothetical protein